VAAATTAAKKATRAAAKKATKAAAKVAEAVATKVEEVGEKVEALATSAPEAVAEQPTPAAAAAEPTSEAAAEEPTSEAAAQEPTPAAAAEEPTAEAATQEPASEAGAEAQQTPEEPRQISLMPVGQDEMARLGGGAHYNPHSILGAHPHDGGVTIRTMRPMAEKVVAVLPDGSEHDLVHEAFGIWATAIAVDGVTDYRLKVTYPGDPETTFDDAYRFLPTLGEVDQHLIAEGRHETLWTVLGSHQRSYDGPMGTTEGSSFALWAPNAQAVRLTSDFNHWNGVATQLRSLGANGIWEIFVPGLRAGNVYRYEILGKDGLWRTRSDPMARWAEVPPANASVVVDSKYTWGDQEWLDKRARHNSHHSPMSIYEVHLGSWRQGLGYRELARELVDYVLQLGFTHVEFLPVAEHPYTPSWGYQVTGYFAPTSRFGHPDDFRFLVDSLHQAGIGVIIDWVPGHFPKDEWALARFDGQALYEYADPRRGDQPDWGTHVFDFGRREVRNFLVANAVYWLEEFHCDGLRVDAVASMLYLDYSRKEGEWAPNHFGGREHLEAIDFLQEATATCYKRCPGIQMIAEESTSWPGVSKPTNFGGLGFGYKWNMGWMHDTLGYLAENPMWRQYHHSEMTFSMVYAYSENYVLPISHDEVVHGKGSLLRKMPGDDWQQHANLRALLAYMWAHPGKQLLFMGSEFAQSNEWSEERSLDWWLLDHLPHLGTQRLVTDLNRLYKASPALWERDIEPAGFEWIDANDYQRNALSFVRYAADRTPLVCVVNFAGAPHGDYRLGLPFGGRWDEVLNTDAESYGGSGVGNLGSVTADDYGWHGRPNSVSLTLPPLAALWLTPSADNEFAPRPAQPE
jgi:1,4-alpha-glucan branching enzyme